MEDIAVIPTLDELASEAMEAANNDITSAATLLVDRLLSEPVLQNRYASSMLLQGCRSKCSAMRSKTRTLILDGGLSTISSTTARGILAAIVHDTEALLNFPLPDGSKLRQATRPLLLNVVNTYGKQAQTMMVRRQWFLLMAQQMPDDLKRIEDVMDEVALQQYYEQAKGHAEG